MQQTQTECLMDTVEIFYKINQIIYIARVGNNLQLISTKI